LGGGGGGQLEERRSKDEDGRDRGNKKVEDGKKILESVGKLYGILFMWKKKKKAIRER